MTDRQRWYREEYLKSDHWRRLRAGKFKQGRKCHVCGSTAHLDVHHATYYRIGQELLTDLIILCRPCHSLEHSKLSDSDKIHAQRLIMQAAQDAETREQSKKAATKPTHNVRRRHRKGAVFANYAFHCLRMVRKGLASDQERNWLKSNASQVARLTV